MPALAGDPYIIAGVAATITAGATLLGLRWKNKHELRLKQLDIQQKKEEQVRADRATVRAQKLQAAEAVGKQLALSLAQLQSRERLYSDLLRNEQVDDYVGVRIQSFLTETGDISKARGEGGRESMALYQLYFPEMSPTLYGTGPAYELWAKLSDTDREGRQELYAADNEVIDFLLEHEGVVKTEREQERFDRDLRYKVTRRKNALQHLVRVLQIEIEAVRIAILNIRNVIEAIE